MAKGQTFEQVDEEYNRQNLVQTRKKTLALEQKNRLFNFNKGKFLFPIWLFSCVILFTLWWISGFGLKLLFFMFLPWIFFIVGLMANQKSWLKGVVLWLWAIFLGWSLLPPYIQDWQQGKQHAKSIQFQQKDCGYTNRSAKNRYICLYLPEAGISIVEERKYLMKVYDDIDYIEVIYYPNTRTIDSFGVVLKDNQQ